MIIHGEEDLVIAIDGAKRLKEGILNSDLKTIKSAGHLLLAEAPKEIYGLTVDFLKR